MTILQDYWSWMCYTFVAITLGALSTGIWIQWECDVRAPYNELQFQWQQGTQKGGWMALICHNSNKLQCLINKCLMCKISYTELFMMMMMMNMLNVSILRRRDRDFKKPLSLSKSLGWENVSGDWTQSLNGLQHDNTSFVYLERHSRTQMYHQASKASSQKIYEVH
jgi:hypothetical protein